MGRVVESLEARGLEVACQSMPNMPGAAFASYESRPGVGAALATGLATDDVSRPTMGERTATEEK